MFGSIHIQVLHPLPNNRKTHCVGQYISKFPIPLPNIRKTKCLGFFGRGVGNLDMYWPKLLVFLLFGRRWGTSICIDPNIEFLSNRKTKCLGLCISKFPIPYRKIEKLNVWVTTYPSSPSPYRTIEKLNWICIDPNMEFFYCSVGWRGLGYVLTQTLSFSIVR
jgi:hypothetical protein